VPTGCKNLSAPLISLTLSRVKEIIREIVLGNNALDNSQNLRRPP